MEASFYRTSNAVKSATSRKAKVFKRQAALKVYYICLYKAGRRRPHLPGMFEIDGSINFLSTVRNFRIVRQVSTTVPQISTSAM